MTGREASSPTADEEPDYEPVACPHGGNWDECDQHTGREPSMKPVTCRGCDQTLHDGHAVFCHVILRNEGKDCADGHLTPPARETTCPSPGDDACTDQTPCAACPSRRSV